MEKEDRIRILIPYIWTLFKRYLNNTGYIVRSEDILANLFMRGEEDVKELVQNLNHKSEECGCGILVKYSKGLTYYQLLLQL
jgi:hypothetical protein